MIPAGEYLFSLIVVLLLGILLGVLFGPTRKVCHQYTWSPDVSHKKQKDRKFRRELKEILADVREIIEELEELLQDQSPKLQKGKVHLQMKTISVGGTSNATLSLVDTTGKPMTIDATYKVTPTASNPASVTVGTPNPDGSFLLTAVTVDSGNTIGATVQRPDGTVITLTPDTLVITPLSQTLASGSVVLT